MKPAFSTVACADWTLDRTAESADHIGALGVEFRTFGSGSTQFACDPALTAPEKVRILLGWAGVSACCLATSVRFDEPVFPPVIGRVISDTERSVREAKSAIDLAQALECPFVRVFAFEYHGGECRSNANARIADRLIKAADHCRNKGVQLVLENGGSFPTASSLLTFLDMVQSPLLGVAYNVSVAKAAGESVEHGVNALGDALKIVKLRDFQGQRPCVLGSGDHDAAGSISALVKSGFRGWLVHEYDRAWLKTGAGAAGDPDPLGVLRDSMRFMFERIGSSAESARTAARARSMARS